MERKVKAASEAPASECPCLREGRGRWERTRSRGGVEPGTESGPRLLTPTPTPPPSPQQGQRSFWQRGGVSVTSAGVKNSWSSRRHCTASEVRRPLRF